MNNFLKTLHWSASIESESKWVENGPAYPGFVLSHLEDLGHRRLYGRSLKLPQSVWRNCAANT
eukprot:4330644-Amphidinium_carterae.1